MIGDLLITLAKLNLAAAAAIFIVMVLRGPILRLFGAQAAYALWLIVPLAATASLLPALRTVPAKAAGPDFASLIESQPWLSGAAVAIWLIGAAVMTLSLAAGQRRFMRRAARGQAGPAIVGVIDPRLILPRDFTERFTPQEQALIRAHERVHMDRDDPRANAVLAAVQCLFWFNPLVHLAASRIRLDQELSCDAAVVARYPNERKRYAATMLKTQLAEQALPVGCHWPAAGKHPLEARIALLTAPSPGAARQLLGFGLVAAIALLTAAAAWSAQPPRKQMPPPPAATLTVMDLLILR
ncbi:MAG TPA: M56 family metallopeptidase [Caulobacter sp.]|nr:M56 family metallopeptidase [Caulobacter sp.]